MLENFPKFLQVTTNLHTYENCLLFVYVIKKKSNRTDKKIPRYAFRLKIDKISFLNLPTSNVYQCI